MKALTVKQPYAHLIMTGLKDVENRKQRTHYRGRIAIHVAKASITVKQFKTNKWSESLSVGESANGALAWMGNFAAGHIIGTVQLVDCVNDSDSKWAFDDHWHWVLSNPICFDTPQLATGKLGLWEWADTRDIRHSDESTVDTTQGEK
jgi:hypothetical protein